LFEASPLVGETIETLKASRSMIIVSLIGMDESFLETAYARYVWTADEILFGVQFVDILEELPDGSFSIDYSHFDEVQGSSSPARVDDFSGGERRANARNCGRPLKAI
jgi:hypothetical protein